MAITIQDIAKSLNLAPSTVSKALNNYPHISPETKSRVLDAAREMNYYPSAAARDLRRRRTDRIGFSFSFPTEEIGEYAMRYINGAVSAAEMAGYNVMLYPLAGNQMDILIRLSRTREVDGLLLMGGEQLEQAIKLLDDENFPFVVLNRRVENPDISFISIDSRRVGLEATRHLIELGHRHIAYIGDPRLGYTNSERLAGYKQALSEAELSFDEDFVMITPFLRDNAYQAMRKALKLPIPPTAVFGIHDEAAIESLRAVIDDGLRVPEDVAVIGVNNIRLSLATKPPLTTIHPPLSEIGRRATVALLARIANNSSPPVRETLPGQLIVRQSTGPFNSDLNMKQNKKIVWEFLQLLKDPQPEELFDRIGVYYAPEVECHAFNPINTVNGLEAFINAFWKPLFQAFPDMQRRNDIFIGREYEGNAWVCSTGYYVGTFMQPWLGIPPNNSNINIHFGEFYRLRAGKIVETYILLDILDVMHQVGIQLLPPSLGVAGIVPSPATHDGLILTKQEEAESEKSVRIVEEMIASLNSPDPALSRYWHPKMMWYGPSGMGITRGIEAFSSQAIDPFKKGISDWKSDGRKALCGEGSYAATVGWPSFVGTHTGNGWLGTTETGKQVSMRWMDFWRREGDLLVENWAFADIIDLFQQLGIDLFARMNEQRKRTI